MQFKVEREVLDLGLKVVGITITSLDNTDKTPAFLTFQKQAYKALKEKYTNYDIEADPIFQGFRAVHKKNSLKRRKNTPISETLLRVFFKEYKLPATDKVTELCNIAMLDSRLPIMVYDLDKIFGDITLKKANEEAEMLINGEKCLVGPLEYVYKDEEKIISRLEVNQNSQTLVTSKTKKILVIIEGNEMTSAEYLLEVASEVIDLITNYCGGKAKIIYK